MKTLGIIAQKGGSGKTTLGIHVAVHASRRGRKVLLVDLDPQASARAWWRRRRDPRPALVQAEADTLGATLDQARNQGFDLVVVDTAPHNSPAASTSARLSDLVVIPSRPAILDLDAIGASATLVKEVRVVARIVLNGCPPPTRHGEPHIVIEAREALEVYGIPVFGPAVSQRAAFSHALIDGRAVTEFDAKGKAAAEIERLWTAIDQDLNP